MRTKHRVKRRILPAVDEVLHAGKEDSIYCWESVWKNEKICGTQVARTEACFFCRPFEAGHQITCIPQNTSQVPASEAQSALCPKNCACDSTQISGIIQGDRAVRWQHKRFTRTTQRGQQRVLQPRRHPRQSGRERRQRAEERDQWVPREEHDVIGPSAKEGNGRANSSSCSSRQGSHVMPRIQEVRVQAQVSQGLCDVQLSASSRMLVSRASAVQLRSRRSRPTWASSWKHGKETSSAAKAWKGPATRPASLWLRRRKRSSTPVRTLPTAWMLGENKKPAREPPCVEFAPKLDHPPNAGPPRCSLPNANKALRPTSQVCSADDLSLEKLLRGPK